MKLSSILLFVLPILTSGLVYEVLQLKCVPTGHYTHINKCEAINDELFVMGTIFKTIKVVNLDIQAFGKQDGKIRPMFTLPKMDWCEALKNMKPFRRNGLMRAIIDVIRERAPVAFIPCPWTPKYIGIEHFTAMSSTMMFLPKGFYRLNLTATEADGSVLASVYCDVQMVY